MTSCHENGGGLTLRDVLSTVRAIQVSSQIRMIGNERGGNSSREAVTSKKLLIDEQVVLRAERFNTIDRQEPVSTLSSTCAASAMTELAHVLCRGRHVEDEHVLATDAAWARWDHIGDEAVGIERAEVAR